MFRALEQVEARWYRPVVFVDQIKERLRNGFHPFIIALSNGRKYRVPHEDFIAVNPKVVVVIDHRGISHTINPLHIVSISAAARKD